MVFRLITILLTILTLSLYGIKAAAQDGDNIIKIAVIDTGFGFYHRGHTASLCRYGHKDFSIDNQYTAEYGTNTPIPLDIHGHGTNVAGLIDEYTKKAHKNFCLVIVKFYSVKQTNEENFKASLAAFKYVNNIHADVINYSGGGYVYSQEEYKEIKNFLDNYGILVAAAGNDNENIDIKTNSYYPAKYDKRIIVVGSNSFYGAKAYSSNYGISVSRWEIGMNQTVYGITMSGTSQATAIATGKIVANKYKSMIDRRLHDIGK